MFLLLMFASVVQTIASHSVPKALFINIPRDCKEIQDEGRNITGIYAIKPKAAEEPFFVYCDMDTRGGGWLYFLNRIDGSKYFDVPWKDYKNGFGNLAREFWLGLEHLNQLTGNDINELLVELVDWNLQTYRMHYKSFSVANEEEGYRLQILGGHSGDLGDSLNRHGGYKFSTIDRDNDKWTGCCAKDYGGGGGWWYTDCRDSALTGRYGFREESDEKGIYWGYRIIKKQINFYTFKEARMMIRPQT